MARDIDEQEARRAAIREERRAALRVVHRRRRRVAGLVVVLLAGAVAGAWSLGNGTGGGEDRASRTAATTGGATTATTTTTTQPKVAVVEHVAMPAQVRGVHVSQFIAGDTAKMRAFLALAGPGPRALNTLQIDVKDEGGRVGFVPGTPPLARRTGAAQRYFDPKAVVRRAHAKGIYLIARIVCFEDPVLATERPSLAIRTTGGGVWENHAGLAWTNPYKREVWRYQVDLAKAAARHGFDEIQFDYVRFPTDGDLSQAVFPGRRKGPYFRTIAAFLEFAYGELRPLGVKVSADVFGLAATRSLGTGQVVKRLAPHLDVVTPMAYPSHYAPGEFNLENPDAAPYATVAFTMRDFRRALRGQTTQVRPFLQDFGLARSYSLTDVKAQIRAAVKGGATGWLLWNAENVYTTAVFR